MTDGETPSTPAPTPASAPGTGAGTARRWWPWLVAALFAATYFGARLPFYGQRLVGEEGIFAGMFYNHPVRPCYGLVARIDGNEIYRPMSHPALMYQALSTFGLVMTGGPLDRTSLTPEQADRYVRICFSLFQLLVWFLIAACLWPALAGGDRRLLVLLLMLMTTPVAVAGSLFLQIDTSSGVVCCALVALAAALGSTAVVTPPYRLPLFAGAALVLGLVGKQEWSIVFGVAIAATVAYLVVWERWNWRAYTYLLSGVAGCAVGNWQSCRFDPVNYWGGIEVLRLRSSSAQACASGEDAILQWLRVAGERMSFIFALVVLLALGVFILWRRRDLRNVGSVFGLLFAGALFGIFFASGMTPDFRYFVPAYGAVCVFFLLHYRLVQDWLPRWLVPALVALLAVHTVIFYVHVLPRQLSVTENQYQEMPAYVKGSEEYLVKCRAAGCLPLLPTGLMYWRDDVEFVNSASGPEGLVSMAKKFHKTACP